jgi:uncharacterized protein (TIGR03086 family)
MAPPSDPRPLLERSFAQSAEVIRGVRSDQMTLPTPCESFDVRTLIGHMLFAARRIAAAGNRAPIPEDGPAVTGLADAAWIGAFEETAAAALAAWAVPGALEGDIVLPFGTFPAPVVGMLYVMEQVTHAWDLARATGSAVGLDQELAGAVLPLAEQLVTPDIRGPEPLPFGSLVEVPADAPAYDRLVAQLGRRPDTAAPPADQRARERGDLVAALGGARRFLRFTLRELGLGGLIKHVTEVERGWARFMVEGAPALHAADEAGFSAHTAGFVMGDGETLAGLLATYEDVGRRTDELVQSLPDLDVEHRLPEAPWFEPGTSWSARRAALHIIAETAQHAGHADILRESLDGAKSIG